MKQGFEGYYPPTKDELEAIWSESIIVVDTNVLLNLYDYTEPTALEFLRLLSVYKEQLRLPFQVAKEYHRRRCSVIRKGTDRYSAATKELTKITESLHAKKKHPHIDEALVNRLETVSQEILDDLNKKKSKHLALIRKDELRDNMTNLFETRTGSEPSTEELERIYKDGAERYGNKVPPGYGDIDKPEPDRYGDLLIWMETIEYGRSLSRPVIFVTDETKEDWWAFSRNKILIGPRTELRDEFIERTQQDIHICSSDSFVEVANERGQPLSSDAAKEISDASKDRRKNELKRQHEKYYDEINKERQTINDRLGLNNPSSVLAAEQQSIKDLLERNNPSSGLAKQQQSIKDFLGLNNPSSVLAAEQQSIKDLLGLNNPSSVLAAEQQSIKDLLASKNNSNLQLVKEQYIALLNKQQSDLNQFLLHGKNPDDETGRNEFDEDGNQSLEGGQESNTLGDSDETENKGE